jgi:hypothetical protein
MVLLLYVRIQPSQTEILRAESQSRSWVMLVGIPDDADHSFRDDPDQLALVVARGNYGLK